MEESEYERIKKIWAQTSIPVLMRRNQRKRPLLRIPYSKNNRTWIRNERRTDIVWDSQKQHWEVPHSWFNDLVERCLEKFGKVYIIQPYREQEKCAPACMNATGHECQCSCMGENHGAGTAGGRWKVIADTFATRWGAESVACRLLSK